MADQQADMKGTTRQADRRTKPLKQPPAPGAAASPQMPGQVPDHSTVPGRFSTRVPRARSLGRPLSEYGTAQEIMRVFRPGVDGEMASKQFEQATAAYEELRKAVPADLPPARPVPGYALDAGESAVAAAIPAATEQPR